MGGGEGFKVGVTNARVHGAPDFETLAFLGGGSGGVDRFVAANSGKDQGLNVRDKAKARTSASASGGGCYGW